MEYAGLFGVEQIGLPLRFVGVGQQQIIEAAFGIAGEPGPESMSSILMGVWSAEDGGDEINIQPARVPVHPAT